MMMVEIAFKTPRKDYYRNPRLVELSPGDYCIVQAERGEDLGVVVRFSDQQKPKRNVKVREVLRRASEEELNRLRELRARERSSAEVCREKVMVHGLPMKVVDVEYQFDGNKITFYFTSEQRVDFRQLVKDLAGTFKTRIELRQIGARDVAKRFPSYGVCGEGTCCTRWLTEFEPVSLRMAKDQNLPLTPSKLTGVCGRLMCCLSYELDTYRTKTDGLPGIGDKVVCQGQKMKVEKIDIFREEIILVNKEGTTQIMGFEDLKANIKTGKPELSPKNNQAKRSKKGSPFDSKK
jgi:cell fate regulator YaaT (PSP1 superfamily)